MLETYSDRLNRLKEIYLMYEDGLKDLENNHLLKVDILNGEIPLLIDIFSKNRFKTISILNSKQIKTCNYH